MRRGALHVAHESGQFAKLSPFQVALMAAQGKRTSTAKRIRVNK